jgi:hypothetical protein
MGHGSGIREVAWLDIAGGGQVVLDGDHAYIGQMAPRTALRFWMYRIRRTPASSPRSTSRQGGRAGGAA